jgi:hypothetical protein
VHSCLVHEGALLHCVCWRTRRACRHVVSCKPVLHHLAAGLVTLRVHCSFQLSAGTGDSNDVQEFVMLDACRRMLNNTYRMRIQNEDARLAADVKRDGALDCWRKLYEGLRLSILHADRSMLLAAYARLFRDCLPQLLQSPRVQQDTTDAIVDSDQAGAAGLIAAVDCSKHPREWKLKAIAALLDELVNASFQARDAEGAWLYCCPATCSAAPQSCPLQLCFHACPLRLLCTGPPVAVLGTAFCGGNALWHTMPVPACTAMWRAVHQSTFSACRACGRSRP